MTGPQRLFHGGVPGLRAGEMLTAGHARAGKDGCPWCAARAAGTAGPGGIDGPSGRGDRIYLTPHRLYAAHYASLFGRGDLYRVEPVGPLERSSEDSVETWLAAAARVVAVVDRAVLLTPTERRRLAREWAAADVAWEHAR